MLHITNILVKYLLATYKDSEYFPLDILSNVLRDSTATVILGYNLQ